jgi:hypothetical protein
VLNEWTTTLDQSYSIAVAYIDFASAFNSVSCTKLLLKLRSFGFCGSILEIITSFLSNRSQSTLVGDSISSNTLLTSGVPQGSVLGPVLFIIYINDVVDIFTACVPSLFADDLKLYIRVTKFDDLSYLQDGLTALFDWSCMWQLSIAFRKCSVLSIGSVKTASDFNINSVSIPFSKEVVDLGVTIDNNLTFSLHINTLVKSAFARANTILRCFFSKDIECLSLAFVTYVRPMLEYCSSVWSPSSIMAINQIEAVQRRFTKRLFVNHELSYFERLATLGWVTLECRRIQADLILCYKIINGLISIDSEMFFTRVSNVINTRGHKFKLSVQLAKRNIRHNFFSVRVVNIWNDLPSHFVEATSVSVFKRLIVHYDLSKYCKVELN